MSSGLDALQAAIGYTFNDIGLLRHALVHSSATSARLKSNERMEFLGDRVLGLVLAEMLLTDYPDEEEGEISYRFTALAQRDALATVAAEIGIGEHLTGGRENPGMLADATEAVICAIYRDGGLEAARTFIHQFWKPMMRENRRPPKDPKTTLQEWAQGRGLGQPVFTVEASLQGQQPARGEGNNKRAAEQAAAETMLGNIQKDEK